MLSQHGSKGHRYMGQKGHILHDDATTNLAIVLAAGVARAIVLVASVALHQIVTYLRGVAPPCSLLFTHQLFWHTGCRQVAISMLPPWFLVK